jgi:phage shock protein PspC (stress-responsive transcriptional regulator)
MKKTISINIAKTIFYIEDDAFAVLDEYLKSIKNHFAADPNRDEIISDMESRIAEQFLAGKEKQKDKIVTLDEVNKLIAAMGRVEDFDSAEAKREDAKQEKRLFRDTDRAMVGGVSAGFGAYFNIDPILFRLLFVIITISGGAGVLIYIVLWVIMPEAKTPEQKSQMRGQGINLSGIQQTVKDRINEAKNSNLPHRFFSVIAQIIRGVIRVIFGLAGFFVTIGTAVAMLAATYALAVGVFDKNSGAMQVPFAQIAPGWQYYVFLVLAYAIIILPLWMLLLAGISMLRGRNIINYPTVLGLMGNWFVALLVGGVLLTHFGPEIKARYEALPQIQHVSKSYMDLGNFSKLEANDAVRVNLIQGKEVSVSANGRQLDMDHLIVENNNGTLKLSQSRRTYFCIFCWTENVTVDVTVSQLDSIQADGASRIMGEEFAAKDFSLELDGASRADLKLNLTGTFTGKMDGASRAVINGMVPAIMIKVDGASNFNGEDFTSKTVVVSTDGASRATFNVTDSLDANADGASRVYYKGTPRVTQETDGAARVIRLDEDGKVVPGSKVEMPDIPQEN